jgi:hypothetical protein
MVNFIRIDLEQLIVQGLAMVKKMLIQIIAIMTLILIPILPEAKESALDRNDLIFILIYFENLYNKSFIF